MADDIEQRLAAAAEALSEHEITTRRGRDLRHRMDQLTAQLASFRAQHGAELQDVERLESVSMTRVLASLEGAREEKLARERAEAEAAHYRIREAEAHLDAVRREYEAVQARLGQLVEAPATYAAALDEKERWLKDSSDPRSTRLLEVADERGRLTSELREMGQALQVARFALQALSQVQARLGNPASWSSHVGFPRRHKGLIHSATAHSRLDELARMAAYADQCVWVLRVELADVSGVDMAPPAAMESLTTGLVTRFTDVWLEHTVSVPDRIRYAHHNVGRCMWLVNDVHNRLAQRAGAARTRLGQLEGERRSLLSGKA